MNATETELLEISRKLPPTKRRELLKFGRALSNGKPKPAPLAEEDGDAAWERILADPKPRPKLAAMAAKALAELKAGKHYPPLRVEDL